MPSPTVVEAPLNIVTLYPSALMPALKKAVRLQIPTLVWGETGIGKSSIVAQVADELKMKLLAGLRASTMDPVDVRGLPTVDPVALVTKWARAEFLPTEADGPCILFLDEITYGSTAVQTALMMLTLERRVGEYYLPKGCAVLAATNLEGYAGTNRMVPALRNRFTHLEVETYFNDWRLWAMGAGVHPVVITFLANHTQYFHPKRTEANRNDRAFPTPRAWETVSKIISDDSDSPSVDNPLITGTVGNEAGTECAAYIPIWRATAGLLDNILNDPSGAMVPDRTDVGLRVMITNALSARMDESNIGTIIQYCDRLGSEEYTSWAVKGGAHRDKRIIHTLEYAEFSAKHQRAIAAASAA